MLVKDSHLKEQSKRINIAMENTTISYAKSCGRYQRLIFSYSINTYCSVSVILSKTSLSLSRYSFIPIYSCFGWLLLRCALTANLTVHLPRGLVIYLSTLAYTSMCIRSEIVHYITYLTQHLYRLVTDYRLLYIHVKFQINGRIRYLL